MEDQIGSLRRDVEGELERVENLVDLEALKTRYLGKKGPIQGLMQNLRTASPEERPQLGQKINTLKVEVQERLQEFENRFLQREESERLEQERLDITLPGRKPFSGKIHPISEMMEEVLSILSQMGFSVQYGPEVESDYYNYEALNFAPDHPARDMQDTFYINPKVLLRTHTSNTQVRVMENHKPPIRIAAPGRCFRNEDITARSHVFFHQVEGLYIDTGVTFASLLETLDHFLTQLFGSKVETRFRPSYFPFVEPGTEVDVSCLVCQKEGCHVCKGSGWLEVLGAGMVHPNVLKSGDLDPEEFSGYAWGVGIERLVMLRYGVSDIRLFAENDLRFLQQF